MKSVVRIMLVVFILALPSLCHALEPGEYVSFGTYGGEPIVWRVTQTDSDSAYLISDKIICLKHFDSEEADWRNSDLRNWLNTDLATEYNESGFLSSSNFSSFDKSVFVSTPHNVTLNYQYSSRATLGYEPAYYSHSPLLDEEKYSLAYRETVEDTIFLPDAEVISNLYGDVNTFGVEYNMALPTEYAVSQFDSESFTDDGNWFYWTGDALSFSADLADGRIVDNTNKIISAKSYNPTIGVRPMCRISSDCVAVLSGNGTEATPYAITGCTDINGNPYVDFTKDETNIKIDIYGISNEIINEGNLFVAGYTNDRKRLTFANRIDLASYDITDGKVQTSLPVDGTAYVRVYIWSAKLDSLVNLTEWAVR